MSQDLLPGKKEVRGGQNTSLRERDPRGMDGGWLEKELYPGVTPARLLLGAILLLGLGLYLVNIDKPWAGNLYYQAALRSMLQSGRNFFFLAAEPGGSVSVDKPPLGLWIQTGFVSLLGMNTIALKLPGILAGTLSLLLLYRLVRRQFGAGAGLLAALVLTLTPAAVAVSRSNILDGMLTFCLLLAAWAFFRTTESGDRGALWLGAFLIGLAFNIKMLQAFLVLPAFFGVYFLGAEKPWLRKSADLFFAFLIILAVSLSWALIVDLTPPDLRPYVGGSADNSALGLITGYNGSARLFGGAEGARRIAPPRGLVYEIGKAGWKRLFTPPPGNEIGWLLPLALLGTGLAMFSAPVKLPLRSREQRGALLWGGWLLTGLVFFSLAGFFHAYYLVMLAPPLGAGVGMVFSLLWWDSSRSRRGLIVLVGAAGVVIAYQVYLAGSYRVRDPWVYIAPALFMVGVLALGLSRRRGSPAVLGQASRAVILASVLLIPLVWSVLTALEDNSHGGLPSAYQGERDPNRLPQLNQPGPVERRLIEYVKSRAGESAYLIAVPSAQQGALIVLETGRPVLYMGGFNGADPVVDREDLARMVEKGELRFVLYSPRGRGVNPEITEWMEAKCRVLEGFGVPGDLEPGRRDSLAVPEPGAGQTSPGLVYPPVLYDCWGE